MQVDLINRLKSQEIQSFIRANEGLDEQALILKSSNVLGLPASVIAQQISGRRKSRTKLPTFYATDGIIFPPALNLEQCSSEKSALHKCETIRKYVSPRRTMLDLTGGFGVDSYFFCREFAHVDYVETNRELAAIAESNHKTLGAHNITQYISTAEEFIGSFSGRVDAAFIDPSRRDSGNRKVVTFQDCVPDVTTLIDAVFRITDFMFIKASPMLDISQGIRDLKHTSAVIITSVDNECKELLFVLSRGREEEPIINAVNIAGDETTSFVFRFSEERKVVPLLSAPKQFLYEPNASIMKGGAFKSIGTRFELLKLHGNTHLYTSDKFVQEFPGRIFSVQSTLKGSPKSMEEYFPERKANVMVRNFPASVEDLKKQLKLKDGGTRFLIATLTVDGKALLVADRIK